MTAECSIDTSIQLYAVSSNPDERTKRVKAEAVLSGKSVGMPIQESLDSTKTSLANYNLGRLTTKLSSFSNLSSLFQYNRSQSKSSDIHSR